MKFLKIALISIITTAFVSGFVSASALAAGPTQGTKEKKFPITYKGESGETKFEDVAKQAFICKKSKTTGELINETESNIRYDYEECEANGIKCNSPGDAAGVVLIKGDLLLVFDDLGPLELANLTTILPTAGVEVNCGALIKLVIKGTFLVLFFEVKSGVAVKTAKMLLNQNGGKPEDKTYWEGGVEKNPKLLTSLNGGVFEESGIGSKEPKVSYEPNEIIFTF